MSIVPLPTHALQPRQQQPAVDIASPGFPHGCPPRFEPHPAAPQCLCAVRAAAAARALREVA